MNLEKINPIYIIENNIIIANNGDVTFCYRLSLPEISTMSDGDFNELHSTLNQIFLMLPENCIMHKQDVFVNKIVDIESTFSNESFYSTSLYNHFKGREYLSQDSYLYITFPQGVTLNRKISNFGVFKSMENADKIISKISTLREKVSKAIYLLSDVIETIELDELEIASLLDLQFSGFEVNKICSPVFTPEFKIGDKYFGIYGLDNDLNQKDGTIQIAIEDKQMSSEISTMYKSYMNGFGYAFNHEHVLNTFFFYDNQNSVKKELEANMSKLKGFKMLSAANYDAGERISDFLKNIESENHKIVRCHFNVTIFDENKDRFLVKSRELDAVFGKAGILSSSYFKLDLPYIFLSNLPGCAGYLPYEYTFTTYLKSSLCYFLPEGTNVKNNSKGYYYCNRNNNIPFVLDTFFEPYDEKLIDNRNYFVIAPSGGGKSFSSRARLFRQYEMGFDQVVINIGGDDKLVRVINSFGKDEALYVKYKQGETLPINPFFINDSINNEKIEFLINFIWLLWGGVDSIENFPNKSSILNKIFIDFFHVKISSIDSDGSYSLSSKRDEYSMQSFFNYLNMDKERIISFYNNDRSLFDLDSLIICLEKFANGNYSTLFLRTKPEIESKKKYIEFELDNIKDHEFLFPIFSMLISDITFNTMWESSSGAKDFYIDEAWKVLEKPGMAVLLKYLYKTIRKFDGSVGIAVQQITDLSIDEIIENAILGNCAIKYILNHKNVISQVPKLKEKLSLTESQVSMLLSIKNATKKSDEIKYTEQLLIMGSGFSRIVRNETSPEMAVIYDSEKSRLRKFDDIYEKTQNMQETITKYLN